jgi:hypothetical protein
MSSCVRSCGTNTRTKLRRSPRRANSASRSSRACSCGLLVRAPPAFRAAAAASWSACARKKKTGVRGRSGRRKDAWGKCSIRSWSEMRTHLLQLGVRRRHQAGVAQPPLAGISPRTCFCKIENQFGTTTFSLAHTHHHTTDDGTDAEGDAEGRMRETHRGCRRCSPCRSTFSFPFRKTRVEGVGCKRSGDERKRKCQTLRKCRAEKIWKKTQNLFFWGINHLTLASPQWLETLH